MGPRRCPRQCGEGSPRGTARVRVGVRVSARVGAGSGSGPVWVCVGPRGSASVSVSVRGLGPRVGPRGSASVPAWVRVIYRGLSAQCRVPGAVRVDRGSASVSVSVRGPGLRVGLRGSASVPSVGGGPCGSASVSASVRGGIFPIISKKNRGADLRHTHFAATFCGGKNIGPEFDTGTRQALCTATVPPKRL